MTLNEYQELALQTGAPKGIYRPSPEVLRIFLELGVASNPEDKVSLTRFLEGAMGMNGEAGEVEDVLKKTLFQGHKFDKYHALRELGDVAWYLALAADAIGYSLEDVCRVNLEKLSSRYPNGFEYEKSLHRNEGDI